jgi:hypothetical protein
VATISWPGFVFHENVEVGDGIGENAPAAPQANAWGRLPRPIVAATMNARIAWMRPEGQRTVQWPYIRAGAPSQTREEGYINKHQGPTELAPYTELMRCRRAAIPV